MVEIPQGYKLTEVGVIPEDWEVVNLSNIGRFSKGKGIRKDQVLTSGIPCIRYGEIYTHHNDYIRRFYSFISPEVARQSQILNQGDLLFAGSGETSEEIGKCVAFLGEEEAYVGGDIVILSPQGYDSLYLGYLMNHTLIVQQKSRMGQGDAVVHITARNLGLLLIPLPPTLREQQAIADALSAIDAEISALDDAIAKSRELKAGAMQRLLTGEERLPSFSGEWEVKKLGEVAPLQRGFDLPTTQLVEGIYPVIYSNGILNHHSFAMAKGPGVVTGRSGTIGRVQYIEDDYWPHNTTLWVTDFKENVPKFIYYLYSYIGFERFSTGSGVPTLNRNDIHVFEALIPQPVEQIAIVAALSEIDNDIMTLQDQREKVVALKQSAMQELLTGRRRLI
ncbi:MAG: restriction endonuclease subunit S [Phototrophicaceae bacterium]